MVLLKSDAPQYLHNLKISTNFALESDYKKYAKKQIEKRGMSFDPEKDTWYGTVSHKLLKKLFKKYGISKEIQESASQHEYKGGYWGVRLPKKAEINVVIHELGHVAAEHGMGIAGELSYSPDLYGLKNKYEAFAENFKYYILYPDLERYYLPEVYMFFNEWEMKDPMYFDLAHDIVNESLSVRGKSKKPIKRED